MYLDVRTTIENTNYAHKKVFLRADLNVPIHQGKILDDYRLQALKSTLNTILDKQGTVILATHLGRPHGYQEDLSTKQLLPWFEHHGYSIKFAPTLDDIPQLTNNTEQPCIILLENLRFFPGEQTGDPVYAHALAQCADYYVNDAFGLLHRDDTSITLVPKLFEPSKRTLGPLIIYELKKLIRLMVAPEKPFVLMMGGGKVSDKLPTIQHLLPNISSLILCPAMVFSFLHAQGLPVGKSLVDETLKKKCLDILTSAKDYGVTIVVPQDYIVARDSFNGELEYCDSSFIGHNQVGIGIGPKTLAQITPLLHQAKTILYNGTMGTLARPETVNSMRAVLKIIADSPAYSVIAGGDSVGVAQQYGFGNRISHLSTGGGATLAYLSGKQLPGLEPFALEK